MTPSTSLPWKESSRKVDFAEQEQNSIKFIERFDGPVHLCWERQELKAMRGACLLTAYANRDCQKNYAKTTMQFVNQFLKGDEQRDRDRVEQLSICSHLRGLESYLVSEFARMIKNQPFQSTKRAKEYCIPKSLACGSTERILAVYQASSSNSLP
eukprot:scaffold6164_cov163-Amphora_coffeaeformis.AAC.11